MKIVVRMAAGLANRMFQYSYYLYLKKHGIEVYVDNRYRATKWKMEDIEWNRIFPNAPINQAITSLIYRLGGAYDILSKIRRHYLSFTCKYEQMSTAFNAPNHDYYTSDKYIIGIFQNAEMVYNVKKEVQDAFSFSPFTDKKNIKLKKEIESCNSVSIHLRKGEDYLLRATAYKGTCNVDYYEKAISLIKEKVSAPKFYVFTDNPKWVRENLKGFEYTLVENNPVVGWGNHCDMQLMSYCKHNIIANSTYSWWGAFLNQNTNKIVIAPLQWFSKEHNLKSYADETICKGWIGL
jgi:hypothetical protein